MSKVLILTANYGSYDEPRSLIIDSVGRSIITEEILPLNLSPMMSAKFIKTHPFFFGKYDYYIWLDGSYGVEKDGLIQALIKTLGDNDIAFLPHKPIWGRSTIQEEAAFCKDLPLYQDQDMAKQVKAYESFGLPDTHTLYAGGLYICKANDAVRVMFERWWEHNLLYTYHDQISLPYALWSSGAKVGSIDPQIFHEYLKIYAHNSK